MSTPPAATRPPLSRLEVLALDCQTTGGSPATGELLEIGWARLRAGASDEPEVRASLLRLTRGGGIPPGVRRVTGLGPGDLRDAIAPARAWRRLEREAATVSRDGAACPAVVHFARFEAPFLRDLHGRWGAGPFPFDLICTHEIARRLLPELPRKGLRAVAGYLGHGVGELRRAGDHVAATARVWRELVARLEALGVGDLAALRVWLSGPPPATGRSWPMERGRRLALPDRPGVYRLSREGGSVLYVGKARSLRARVNSHFRKRAGVKERGLEMLSQARRIEVTETATALEAALLEADEIKRLEPPYNIALRERDRQLAFFSRDLGSCRDRADGDHPLGPFSSPESLRAVVALSRLLADPARVAAEGGRAASLGVPASLAPDAGFFSEGLARLCLRQPAVAEGGRRPGRLLEAGRRLWRAGADSPTAGRDAEEAREPSWSGASVEAALAALLARAHRERRRGLWLLRLSDCALGWSPPECRDGPHRLIVVAGGRVVDAAPQPPGAPVPLPPGHGRTLAERRRGFDLAVWDRMSALRRELLGLVAAGATVALRLGPGRPLGREELARSLA